MQFLLQPDYSSDGEVFKLRISGTRDSQHRHDTKTRIPPFVLYQHLTPSPHVRIRS